MFCFPPIGIVTDQDKAMQKATKNFFSFDKASIVFVAYNEEGALKVRGF